MIKGVLIIFLFIGISCGSKRSKESVSKEPIQNVETRVKDEKTPISPMLVGTNVWYIDPSEQVWNLTAKAGVTSIRIGGHKYDDEIPSKAQLVDWVTRIQAIGAEPIFQVSQYESSKAAAELVKYFNVDLVTGKAIKYWNIGNEPWLQNNKPELSTVGTMVEKYFKPHSRAMKAVDPSIKIYGPDFCYYIDDAMNDLFGGKNDISGKIPGKSYYYADGISWHRYPQDESMDLAYDGIEDFRSAIEKSRKLADKVNFLHKRTGDDAIGWGIGEYNAKGGKQVHTWKNGQMFAGILGLSMKYGATYATSWSMFENGGGRRGTDFSFIDGEKMTPRPSYRHMEMVAKNFSGFYVDGKSSLSDILIFGSVDGNKLAIMVMNRGIDSVAYDLGLNYANQPSGSNSVKLMVNAQSNQEYSGTIGALATQTLVFEGDEVLKIEYSNENFENQTPPTQSKLMVLGE